MLRKLLVAENTESLHISFIPYVSFRNFRNDIDAQNQHFRHGENVCVYVHPTKDIYCWGINQFGELGLGDTTLRTTMQKVGSPF